MRYLKLLLACFILIVIPSKLSAQDEIDWLDQIEVQEGIVMYEEPIVDLRDNARLTRSNVQVSFNMLPVKVVMTKGEWTHFNQIGIIQIDGEIGFCIDPLRLISVTGGYQPIDPSLVFNDEQLFKRVSQIALYGKQLMEQTGDQMYYAIAQTMIIESLGWTLQTITDLNNQTYQINHYRLMIEEAIKSHEKIPSFSKNIQLGYTNAITLEDENHVINKFKSLASNKCINAKTQDNQLILQADCSNQKVGIEFTRYQELLKPIIVYKKDNAQTLLRNGLDNSVKFNLEVETKKTGELEINKIDAKTGKSLVGAEFKLVGKQTKYAYQVKMLGKSKIVVPQLPYDQYELIETQAPIDYLVSDQVYTFTIDEQNKNVQLKIPNQIKQGKIQLSKIDSETKEVLEGVTFELLDSTKKLVEIIKTNNEGQAIFKSNLDYGLYFIREKQAHPYYQRMLEDMPIQINQSIVKVEIGNKRIKYDLLINKVDEISNEPLKDAVFQIKTTDNQVIDMSQTNEKGEVIFKGLFRDVDYTIEEIKAPDNYILGQPQQFNLGEQSLHQMVITNKKREIVLEVKELPKTGKDHLPYAYFIVSGFLIVFMKKISE